jgi:iron-sulfur cluster repair protein YtfE (RIC family)
MTRAEHWVVRRTGIRPTPAPDPAQWRSGRTVLDEATRPVGAEPAAGVSFSRIGLAVGSHLVDVHDHYRAELAEVRTVLTKVREGTTSIGQARAGLNATALRANDWTLAGVCQAECRSLTQHHEMETQAVFPHLRRSHRSLEAVIDRLNTEHRAIHELLEEIDAALVELARRPGDYHRIGQAIDLLTDTLLSHFAYEERELIGPLAQYGFFPGQVR